MKEIKTTQTIEVVTGYEAMDGTIFRTREECEKYESSAKTAAKAAAWHYLVGDRGSYDVFKNEDEESLIVFDIPDMNAYLAIRTWAEGERAFNLALFTPDYIGKRTAFHNSWGDIYFCKVYATKEAMLEFYTKEIESLFADKATDPQ